jgi:hypothetical protein
MSLHDDDPVIVATCGERTAILRRRAAPAVIER